MDATTPSKFDRYASILRYVVTIIAAPIATKLALDAGQTQSLVDWVMAGLAAAITFGPMIWTQIFRPSNAAMEVAKQADKVMSGDRDSVVVKTPQGIPDIVVMNNTNVNGRT